MSAGGLALQPPARNVDGLEKTMNDPIESLLDYWFGEPLLTEAQVDAQMKRWFTADPQIDAQIESLFGSMAERAGRGGVDQWRSTATGRLALILLLDQLPRHIFRGTAAAFRQDGKALDLTLSGIESEMDRQLPELQRAFFYMPLQHAESLSAQRLSLQRYGALAAQTAQAGPLHKAFREFARYAQLHHDIVVRFGRFPHRNSVLGREDTIEEQAFRRDGGPSFGQ
jgi:uncharacterized protein (DUF924 family)